MKYKIFILFAFTAIVSCNNDDDSTPDDLCIEYVTAYVENVNHPTNGLVGEDIEMEIFFHVGNGCGQFHKFEETSNGNMRTIVAEAKYEGCICTQAVELRTAVYTFNASTPGDYELKFKSGENEYFLVQINIQ